MGENKIRKNIKLFGWFFIFGEPVFWGPILISYIINIGNMKLSEVYFMESVVLLGVIILEIPSGALADLIGRKKTILLGSILHTASIIKFSFVVSPVDVWIANIIWMIGYSLHSGADSAFLFDSLKEIGEENDYTRLSGRFLSERLILVAFCSLIAGFLFKINPRLPLLLSIPGVLISCISVFYFTEPIKCEKFNSKRQLEIIKSGLSFVVNNKEVRWIIGFVLLIGVSSKIWFFTYNPYFELVNLKPEYYGIMFFLLNIIAWFFSRNAHKFIEKWSEYNCIVSLILLIGFPILIMGLIVSKLSLVAILLQNVVRGISSPFSSNFLNQRIESSNRATIISIQSALGGLMQFCALGLFGFILTVWELNICLQFLGLTVLCLGYFVLVKYHKIFR